MHLRTFPWWYWSLHTTSMIAHIKVGRSCMQCPNDEDRQKSLHQTAWKCPKSQFWGPLTKKFNPLHSYLKLPVAMLQLYPSNINYKCYKALPKVILGICIHSIHNIQCSSTLPNCLESERMQIPPQHSLPLIVVCTVWQNSGHLCITTRPKTRHLSKSNLHLK